MKRTKRKLLSGVLAATLLLQTVMPSVVFAVESAPKTIVGFSALEQKEYTLPMEADEVAVNELLESFPETITAKVEYIVMVEDEDSSKPEEKPEKPAEPPVTDDGTDDPQSPEIASDSNAGAKEEKVTDDEKSDGEYESIRAFGASSIGSGSETDTSLVEKVVSEKVELAVTWESDKELVTAEAGEFTYTAVLSDSDKGKYDLANGVSLPTITVLVAQPPMLMAAENAIPVGTEDALKAAIIAVEEGGTIQLTENIATSRSVSIPTDKTTSFTLDLNGKDLSGSGSRVIDHQGSGTLTISGSGGTVSSSSTAGASSTIDNGNGGTVTISGSATVKGTASSTIYNRPGGTVTISGGSVTNSSAAVDSSAIFNEGGTVTISGGIVSSSGTAAGAYAINNNSGTVTITATSTVVIKSPGAAMNKAPTTIANGVIGGASTNVDGTPLVAYQAENISSYKYLEFKRTGEDTIATIGVVEYTTLQLAINDVTEGQTIVLQNNDAWNVTVSESTSTSFTLDLNGTKSTASSITHNGTGTLNITSSAAGGWVEHSDTKVINGTGPVRVIFTTLDGSFVLFGGKGAMNQVPSFDETVSIKASRYNPSGPFEDYGSVTGSGRLEYRASTTLSFCATDSFAASQGPSATITVHGVETKARILTEGLVTNSTKVTGNVTFDLYVKNFYINFKKANGERIDSIIIPMEKTYSVVSEPEAIGILMKPSKDVVPAADILAAVKDYEFSIEANGKIYNGKIFVSGNDLKAQLYGSKIPEFYGLDYQLEYTRENIDFSKASINNAEGIRSVVINVNTTDIFGLADPGTADYSVANQNIKIGENLSAIQAVLSASGVGGEVIAGTLAWSETDGGEPLTSYTFAGNAGDTKTLYWTFAPSSSSSYKAVSGSTDFTLTAKEVPTLTLTGITKAYDGVAVTKVGGTAKVNNITVPGTFAFESAPEMKNAGAYNVTVQFTPTDTDTYETARTSVTVTIGKATITIAAKNKSAYIGYAVPTLNASNYTVRGLASGESLAAPPTIAYATAPDMSKADTVAIIVSDAKAPDRGNYNDIVYQHGTLTISSESSGSSYTSSTGTTNRPTQGSTTVPPTISGDTATVTVPEATVKEAITKAQTEATKNGTTANGITVEIKTDTGSAANLTANLPKTTVDALVSGEVRETRITSGVATIILNLNTLKEIQKQTGTDVIVTATKIANTALSAEVQAQVGNRPVYDLSITGANGVKVTNFGTGTVTVSIPYTLGENETAGNVVAYYIDGTGKAVEMPNSVYNPETKTLSFVTSHFSLYAVGYKAGIVGFADTANHWAKDSIQFAAARGLLAGTGDGNFFPDSPTTREMFTAALSRMAGRDMNGLTDLAPEQTINREQMAVILHNYAKAIGYELPRTHVQKTFADDSKISQNAKEAVKAMQMAGVLAGKNGNQFDPQGTATRAEVSALLERFVKLTISSDSTQGWRRNDSGKWMFFEGGRPVTGTRSIGGVNYTFNPYGEMVDLPKEQQ